MNSLSRSPPCYDDGALMALSLGILLPYNAAGVVIKFECRSTACNVAPIWGPLVGWDVQPQHDKEASLRHMSRTCVALRARTNNYVASTCNILYL